MADNRSSDDGVFYTVNVDEPIFQIKGGDVLSFLGQHISEISNVSDFIIGSGMGNSGGVEVGSSGLAALDQVA